MERKEQGSFTRLAIFVSAVVLLVSFVAINANITGEQTKITMTSVTDPSQVSLRSWADASSKDVVWDNGMQYDYNWGSQDDPTSDFEINVADDFQFDVDQLVNDVHWIGCYWNGSEDGDFDWKVTFYNDFGDGTKPGTIINTWIFSNAQVNETFIEEEGGTYWFSYSVNIPTPVSFIAGTKYWISIQGVGPEPPQSGWAMHSDQILLHEAVFKSLYFGWPYWTNVSTTAGYALDMCFQLTYEEPWPDHKMHFPQLPDLIGWNVNATFPVVLADDWECSMNGPLTDIHFWGSWKNIDGDPTTDDFFTPMPLFQLIIYSNIAADDPLNPYDYSIPGAPLWSWEGEIPGIPSEPPTLESWMDPLTGDQVCNDHVPYWRYDFFFDQAYPEPEPFDQDSGTIYWLSVTALGIQTPYQWGWKNSRDHFEDDAVLISPTGEFVELYEPPRCNWFDVYFNESGEPEDMESSNYYGDGWYYYELDEWWNIWFYDNPFTYDHYKNIVLDFFVEPVGAGAYAELAINWSTDIWSLEGVPDRPPLPEDELENPDVIGRAVFPVTIGSNSVKYTISDYNPEWISIDFRANDVIINGTILHECVKTSMDMAFVITGEEIQQPEMDFGDAPDPTYPTLLVNDGARHTIVPNVYLGAAIDPEVDGQPDPNALGDDNDGTDDEDGVIFTTLLYPGYPAKVKVTASVPGYLDAWMDFNADGDWDDPQEQIFTIKPLAAGPNDLFYGVPTDAVAGPTISRFRFSTFGGLREVGLSPDGEVEDYEVDILEPIGDLKMHYLQPPDLEGWDVIATFPFVVADDWRCTETGPVTDIHFWGSWKDDAIGDIDGFWLSIYSNVPASPPDIPFSHPGDELWSAYITEFTETSMEPFPQGWYDPIIFWWHPNHDRWFRYDITGIEEPFIQKEDTIYWLGIRAEVANDQWPVPPLWGWKTSYEHFEDAAMYGWVDSPEIVFEPLFDPIIQLEMDMAFAITGGVPILCGDVNNSGVLDLADVIYLLNLLFKGGPAPQPYDCVGDVKKDGKVDLTDALVILNYLFKGGTPPDPTCCNPIWSK